MKLYHLHSLEPPACHVTNFAPLISPLDKFVPESLALKPAAASLASLQQVIKVTELPAWWVVQHKWRARCMRFFNILRHKFASLACSTRPSLAGGTRAMPEIFPPTPSDAGGSSMAVVMECAPGLQYNSFTRAALANLVPSPSDYQTIKSRPKWYETLQ